MFFQINLTKHFLFLFTILLISVSISCKEKPEELIIYPDVTIELCSYFQSFEKEAAKRGLIVDLRNAGIKGRLTKIHGNAVGICKQRGMKEVLIDRKFWERSSQLKKELIVFHELGHCYLNKMHDNEATPDGICQSIMRSGQGGCIDFYTQKTRAELLDKLFE